MKHDYIAQPTTVQPLPLSWISGSFPLPVHTPVWSWIRHSYASLHPHIPITRPCEGLQVSSATAPEGLADLNGAQLWQDHSSCSPLFSSSSPKTENLYLCTDPGLEKQSAAAFAFPPHALIRSEMLCRLQFKKVVNAPFIILLWVHLLQFCKGWTVPLMTSISPSALKANHNKQETILLLSLWSRVSRIACSCLKG